MLVRRALASSILSILPMLLPAAPAAADTPAREARPQDVPRVLYTGVEPTSTAIPNLVTRRASERLGADLAGEPSIQLVVITDDPTDTVPAPAAVLDRTAEGKAALDAATAALGKKDWPAAEQKAGEAVGHYEASAAVLTDLEPLARAWNTAGTAAAMQGREADARAAFRQALALDAGKPPAFAKQQRKARKAWDAASQEHKANARGGIHVEVKPGEASSVVFLDGQSQGEAPIDILDVAAGRHLLSVVAPGHHPYGAAIAVTAGAPTPVDVTLHPLVVSTTTPDAVRAALRAELKKRTRGGVLDASAKPVAARLAERVGATHIVLGMLSPSASSGYTLRVFLFRADGKLLAELDAAALDAELLNLENQTLSAFRATLAAIRAFPADRDITTSLTQVTSTGGDGGSGTLVEDANRRKTPQVPIEEPPARPIWKRPLFWVGVAGVVIGGTALAFAIASSGSPTSYDGTITLP